MNIAQVAPRYFPFIGGVETVVKNISEEMVSKGHKVEVLTLNHDHKLPEYEQVNGVIVRRFPNSGVFFNSNQLAVYLQNNLGKYQIVHAHNFHTFIPHMVTRAGLAKKNSHIVITGHYHGRGSTKLSSLLLHFYRPVLKKLLSEIKGIICVSDFEAKLIIKHFNISPEKIAVIPNGTSLKEIFASEPYNVKGNKLLVVSRLEKYKNVDLAIKAVSFLPDDYELYIIGSGPYGMQLKHLADKLDLRDRVHFLGRLENNEVFRWYKTCNIVLNLSDLEAFGLTAIEALAAGKPVVVNKRTALRELAECLNGIRSVDVANTNPKNLAKVIQEHIAASFTPSSLEHYRWDVIAEQMVAYYNKLIV